MSTLRISDAPLLPDVDGTEKIPTGGRGDYAISVDQIKDHIFQDVGKELVGLGNVDNTSDLDKPVSTAQQAALNLKADKTYVDTNLDLKADKTNVYTRSETSLALSKKADLVNGVVPENQIPSSFNDVLEFTTSTLPIVGESGKIYVTTDTNRTWRWSVNQYVEVSNGGVSDSTLKLHTPRKIANVDFDGTQDISVPHNNLTNRNIVNAHSAESISTASGEDQQQINDYNGVKWRSKSSGYDLNARVTLEDGALVMSTVQDNTNNPNENLSGWRIVGNFKRLDLSGYKLSKDSDITALLTYVLSLSVVSPIEIILPCGEFLLNATVRTPNESLGVILDLNGSTLRPTSAANLMDNYTGQRFIVSLASNTEHPVVIKNGVLDGALRDQNLFADTDYENSISVKRTDGVVLRGKHVAMQNLTVKNQFGVVSRLIGCNTIDVSDVTYENVGGSTSYGDIFLGDMFYIEMGAAHQHKILANFVNVNAVGKRSDQFPENQMPVMYTRTGITLEGFAEQVESDVRINVVNSSFENVERWLHAETPQTVNVSIDNSEIGSVLMLAGWNLHKLHADVSASDIQLYEGWYNSSYKGLGAAIGQASVSVTLDSCTVSHVGSANREAFGTWCTTKATNTRFNIYGKWAANTHITLDNCIIAVLGNLAVSNLTVGGSLKFTDTEVFYSGSYIEVWEGTENYRLKRCNFYNIDFDVSVTRNIAKLDDCRLYLTDATKVQNKFWEYRDTYGFVIQYPKYFWGLSKNTLMGGRYTRETFQKSGGSVSILTPSVVNLFNRYGLLLMVAKGCENTTHLLDGIGKPGGWKGYIVALANYDPFSDTYSFLTPRIYCGLSYEEAIKGVTIDNNFVITNFGTLVNFAEVSFVPYHEISSLPYVPPQLLNVTTT